MRPALRFPDFSELLISSMRRGAALARELEGRVGNMPKLSEATAVKQALTDADTGVQEVLLEGLRTHFPQVSLEAEEDTSSVALFPTGEDAVVVIDPIDGTLHSYLERRGPYAVMMGLALSRIFEASLISLPREGLLFGATRGKGAFTARVNGPPRAALARADGNRVLVSHGLSVAVSAALEDRGFECVPACGGAIAVAPLIIGVRAGLRLASTSNGISVRGRIGALISREAGAVLSAGGGRDFPDDLDSPADTLCVATSDEDLARLTEALEAAGQR